MLESINRLILLVADPLLGWLLHVPRDVALLVIAFGTALVLNGVRRFTTDQAQLKRCKADKVVLVRLMKGARARGDRETVQRLRQTLGQIGMAGVRAEGRPLLVSLLPIIIIAVWAFARIGYLPPEQDQPLTLNVYFDQTMVGDLAYLLPQEGMQVDAGLIRRIEENVVPARPAPAWLPAWAGELFGFHDNPFVDAGIASWDAVFTRQDDPYILVFNHRGKPVSTEVTIDGVRYSEPLLFPEEGPVICLETVIQEYRPLGFIPGIALLAFQPWIVGYLLIVIPLSILLKPVLKVY